MSRVDVSPNPSPTPALPEIDGSSDSGHSSLRISPTVVRPNEVWSTMDSSRGTRRVDEASVHLMIESLRSQDEANEDLLSRGREMEFLIKNGMLRTEMSLVPSPFPDALNKGCSSDSGQSSLRVPPSIVCPNEERSTMDPSNGMRADEASVYLMIESLRSQDEANEHLHPTEDSEFEVHLSSGREMEFLIKNGMLCTEMSLIPSSTSDQGCSSESSQSSLGVPPSIVYPNEERSPTNPLRGTRRAGKASRNRIRLQDRANLQRFSTESSEGQNFLLSGCKMELKIKEQQLSELIAAHSRCSPRPSKYSNEDQLASSLTVQYEDTRSVTVKSGTGFSITHFHSSKAAKIPATDNRRLGAKSEPIVEAKDQEDRNEESRDMLSKKFPISNYRSLGETLEKKVDPISMDCDIADHPDNFRELHIERLSDPATPTKIPATDSRRLGVKPRLARSVDQIDSIEESKNPPTPKKISHFDIGRLGEKAQTVAEPPASMNCDEEAGAVSSGCVSSVSNANVMKPMSSFHRAKSIDLSSMTVRSKTHIRKIKKTEAVKPILEEGRTGRVAKYNEKEGYGFVTVNSAHSKMSIIENLFVHRTGLKVQSLTTGARVKFDIVRGKKGLEATNVCYLR